MKKSDQQALLRRLAAQGYTVNDLGTMRPDETVVLDLDCYEQQDGAAVAYFTGIPGAQVSGVDLVHAIALLEAIAQLVAEHIREDESAAGLRGEERPDENDGGHSGVIAVSQLAKRGVRFGYVPGEAIGEGKENGAYCIALVGVKTALIEAKTKEALGQVFGQLVQMGLSIYHHERREAEAEAENPTQGQGQDIVLYGTPRAKTFAALPQPLKTND